MSGITAASYAESVVGVLREHFPGVADPVTAGIIADAVRRQVANPRDGFEVIVDNPASANWRLKAHMINPRRVRLACCRLNYRDSDVPFTDTVNDALSTLGISS